MQITTDCSSLQNDIRSLYLESFDSAENQLVAALAIDLLQKTDAIHYAAINENTLLGHIAFSPLTTETQQSPKVFLLSPLAVRKASQKRGVATTLINKGKHYLKSIGVNDLLTYGDPQFYGRFGFAASIAKPFIPPYPLEYDFGWIGVELNPYNDTPKNIAVQCVRPLQNSQLW